MEDPKRMRTKLRLDLADVRRQIEDMEDLLKNDKSHDNLEAHRKLVDYEIKLKNQYERMTGLSVEQANKLEQKGWEDKPEGSVFAAIIGILGGLLISWGFYNTLLHSILGFAPTDVLNWFIGTNKSVPTLTYFMDSLTYPISFYLITVPIGGGAVFALLSSILEKNRSGLLSIVEGIAYLLTTGFLSYILIISPDAQSGAQNFKDLLFTYTLIVVVSGILIFLSTFSIHSKFRKLLSFSSAILIVYSGVQLYLLTTEPSSVDPQLAWQWPFIIVPVIIATFLYSIQSVFKFK